MKKERLSMLILSCDKFSDLWDGNIHLLEKNWGNRNIPTYIVTESIRDKAYENVLVLNAGINIEFSDRLAYALEFVDSEYVLITLDDYYLINVVDNSKIEYLLDIMDTDKIDYFRLYKRPMRAQGEKLNQYKNIFRIKNEAYYSVNLCVGIWRKSFLKKVLMDAQAMNPWQFEVSLSTLAVLYQAKCYVSRNDEFIILDVVRKGKILNHAHKYFKKYGIYYGNRPVQSKWYEFKLAVRTCLARHMPLPIVKFGKKLMKSLGYKYYTD